MQSFSPDRLAQLRRIAREVGTPVYVYDALRIREQLRQLSSFDTVRFAQKACPNVQIQRLLRAGGAAVDCVSLGELERALRAGFTVEGDALQKSGPGAALSEGTARVDASRSEIVFTADLISPEALDRVIELQVPLNAGSEDMLAQVGERRRGHPVWLRLNPGFGSGHSKKVNTGGESSKHGIWHENLPQALRLVERFDLDLVGLHMHIGSGADLSHLERVCEAMVEQVRRLGRDVRAISGGGGLSVPYRDNEAEVDVAAYYRCWDAARKEVEAVVGHAVHLEIEPGRFLTAQAGLLLAEVRATKTMGNHHFTLVDAGFNDLMRPAMYGAHHEIELLTREEDAAARPLGTTLVAGPLCESGDVFTQEAGGDVAPRQLGRAEIGDWLVFRDAGAYGASMSSNYNSRPLIPEVLIEGESHRLIRRRQTMSELLALEEC